MTTNGGAVPVVLVARSLKHPHRGEEYCRDSLVIAKRIDALGYASSQVVDEYFDISDKGDRERALRLAHDRAGAVLCSTVSGKEAKGTTLAVLIPPGSKSELLTEKSFAPSFYWRVPRPDSIQAESVESQDQVVLLASGGAVLSAGDSTSAAEIFAKIDPPLFQGLYFASLARLYAGPGDPAITAALAALEFRTEEILLDVLRWAASKAGKREEFDAMLDARMKDSKLVRVSETDRIALSPVERFREEAAIRLVKEAIHSEELKKKVQSMRIQGTA
jgi:hypothetical protein